MDENNTIQELFDSLQERLQYETTEKVKAQIDVDRLRIELRNVKLTSEARDKVRNIETAQS